VAFTATQIAISDTTPTLVVSASCKCEVRLKPRGGQYWLGPSNVAVGNGYGITAEIAFQLGDGDTIYAIAESPTGAIDVIVIV
jgi:hypothetical protein